MKEYRGFLLAICVLMPAGLATAQGPAARVPEGKPVIEVKMNVRSRSSALVVFDVTTINSGTAAAYLVTDTQRVDRSKGPYIGTDPTDPTVLVFSFQFYPPNPFNPFVDHTSAHLIRLGPGESHEELVKLSLPLRTTEPPFSDSPGTKTVSSQSIKMAVARVGMLPASVSVADLVKRKETPHDSFNGREQVSTGVAMKSLYEIQEVVHSNALPVNLE